MINLEILENNIVGINVKGYLEEGDFEGLTSTIDLIIDMKGNIKILLDAANFEGWKDRGAVKEHFEFVKSHHKKVDKVALIEGHIWQQWLATIADIFMHPEVKIFEKNEHKKALKWLNEK